ncbi:pimeloyl-ACP methyl ester carboxylesterase [Tepidamorphus gemmatus]|uniref:Pimeloyl-ACP methyl ester carboxylesterase n=1 Tax=Tepidamorphus gemmatus TaxID=747076 RepID=A0A4R3MIY8_9HYPH|nr:alpha/beta fold hydrolase [Tepidamorphus gemmatus]TCT13293.1 pimeloyl-ACP methyl ester carboxylesterase [Tepidamorphus gemmatus]
MRMILAGIAAVAVLLAGFWIYTAIRADSVAAEFAPIGKFVRIDDVSLHYVDAGVSDGPAVVLLHGASSNLRDPMLALGDRLSGRYRVVAVDRPGSGWSSRGKNPDVALASVQAEYIVGLLDALGIDRAIFVAHSWSGALALELALDHPERTAGLVLIAPVSHPWPGGISWYYTTATLPGIGWVFVRLLPLPLGEMMLDGLVAAAFEPQTPPPDYPRRAGVELVLRPEAFRANAQDVVRLLDFVTAQSPRYGEVAVPTSILVGNADRIVSPRFHSRLLAEQIPGAKLITFDKVGHMVHHAAPEAVAAEVDRVAAAAAAGGGQRPADDGRRPAVEARPR